jgi:hypothetical protein
VTFSGDAGARGELLLDLHVFNVLSISHESTAGADA